MKRFEQIGKYNLQFLDPDEYGLNVCRATWGSSTDTIHFNENGRLNWEKNPKLLDYALGNKPGKEYRVWDSWTRDWMRPGLRSQIFSNHLKTGPVDFFPRHIALKQPFPLDQYGDSTAVEQFQAMEILSQAGVLTVPTYLATEVSNRFVLDWYRGKHPPTELDEPLTVYISELVRITKDLAIQGRWNPKWWIERQPNNYFVGDITAKDILKRFVTLDPVSKSCMFVW